MRYNSNKSNRPTVGNELPYSGQPGSPKINKQLKQLEEDINNVAGRLNGYVGEDDSEINGMIGDALDEIRGDVGGVETTVANLIPRLDGLENTVSNYATQFQTADLQAQNAAFHKVVAGKYVFQNGYSITGTSICKINNGSVVYATDGTNSVLVDYTDKDAWVAKAKVEDGEHFSIYSNGVLTFTQSGGWSVYVIGNDFGTDDLSIPQVLVESSEDTPSYVNETPVNIETGVTIGGTLYAALARDYTFDSIEVTSATINSATINVLNATSASIDAITTDNVIAQDAVVTDANIEHFNNSERNFTGYVDVDTHHGADNIYIKLNKFTGTYYLKLVNGSETMFTATVIWNGTNPVVNYYENTSISDRDCLYKIILTDVGLYFVTNSSGNLYYGWDSFDAVTPESSYYIDEDETEICDYLVKYASRTVFLGNHSAASGMDVLGEVRADYISQTEDKPGFDYRGNATLSTLPSAVSVGVGAVYNITEDSYTDARFVEGAGKPINAGDDVIAVEVTTSIPGEETITESTFDYNINDVRIDEDDIYYATLQGLYKNGELVDSTPINKIFIDINKNIWATTRDTLSIGKYINGVFTETFTCTAPINDFVITSYGTAIIGTGYGGIGPGLFKSISSDTWVLLPNAATNYTGNLTYYDDNHIYAGVYTGGYSDGGLEFYNGTECVLLNDQVGGNLNARPVVRSPEDIWYLCYVDQDGANGNLYHYDGETWTGYHVSDLVVDYDESQPIGNGYGLAIMNNKLYASFSSPIYSNSVLLVANLNEPNLEFHYVTHDIEHDDWTETVLVNISQLAYSPNRLIGWNWNSNDNPIDIYSIYATDPIPTAKVLKWDKFSAGVNYDNFAATNITASTALKSEGTLEVDGTSQFDNNVTVTGDITQTGDLNITGNETLSGDLVVGGKVESDKLYGKELHVNDTGNDNPITSYLDASSTGVTSNVNITENGNITQTGNYTTTGNLTRTGNETISGVVIIGDLD